ncbi:hypothetical protein [Nitratireductor luteus]|uniref:hypothetical protein n=1 Tax=Nitratireductor luteus TaxID=2976980 RepID=UPI0022401E9F|nr:hypothetical protein [Nitratireductor luteus]
MATILPFRRQTAARLTRRAARCNAEIIIFPGVRYERGAGIDAGKNKRPPVGGTRAKRRGKS